MEQRKLWVLSILLTLVIIGGGVAIYQVTVNHRNEQNAEFQSQIENRETEYNGLIEQANQKIQALNEQVTVLQDGRKMVSGKQTISLQEAVELAKQNANDGDYLLGIPELADYQGMTVYGVSFTSGTVYVDAFTGEIVFSSVPHRISADQAIQLAGQYLKTNDLSKANVQSIVLEGKEFFKVTIGNYVIYVDAFGNISKVQLIQYAPQAASSSTSPRRSDGGEHENEDD